MARPYLLKKRGKFWHCRLAGAGTLRSTGLSVRDGAEEEAKRAWVAAATRPQRATCQKTPTELGPPKSGKPRACPLPSGTAATLHRVHDDPDNIRLHPTDLVFCYDDGSRLENTWWKKSFAGAMKGAGSTGGRAASGPTVCGTP